MEAPEGVSTTVSSDPAPRAGSTVQDPSTNGPGHTPVHAARGTGRRLAVLAALFLVLLAAGFFVVQRSRASADAEMQTRSASAADAPLMVDVVPVVYGPPRRELTLPAECRAWYETTIYARVSGYLNKWFVDIGDRVQEGQTLATIDTPELDQQLQADLAKVEAERSQIKLQEANRHFCEVTLARYKDAPKGVVSDLERDQKEADYQTAQARLAAAQCDLNSVQADVDRIRAMIAFRTVTAPFSGTITQRHVDIGDLITAGSNTNTTSLFSLAQSDEIRVIVDVPQNAAPDIHDGDEATVTADEYPGRIFKGTVARNASAINTSSKTLRVEVDIPNKEMALLPGMFVRINFQLKERQPLLEIPASALTFRTGGAEVAIVAGDGKVAFRKVSIAHDLGDAIELRDGLNPGDRVALNISSQVGDGDVVVANVVPQAGAQGVQPAGAPPSGAASAPPAPAISAARNGTP